MKFTDKQFICSKTSGYTRKIFYLMHTEIPKHSFNIGNKFWQFHFWNYLGGKNFKDSRAQKLLKLKDVWITLVYLVINTLFPSMMMTQKIWYSCPHHQHQDMLINHSLLKGKIKILLLSSKTIILVSNQLLSDRSVLNNLNFTAVVMKYKMSI